jgi:hypothetical protein
MVRNIALRRLYSFPENLEKKMEIIIYSLMFSIVFLRKERLNLLIYISLALLAVFVSGSPDDEMYKKSFYNSTGDFESGYLIFQAYIRNITDNFLIFKGMISLFITYSMYKFMDKKQIVTGVVLILYFSYYFWLKQVIQIRSMLALSIVLLTFNSLEKNQKISFLYLLIAITFHQTMLMFLPIYIIIYKKIKIRKEYFLIGILFSIILGYLGVEYGEAILRFFANILEGRMDEKIIFYLDSYAINGYEINTFEVKCLVVGLFLLFTSKHSDKNTEMNSFNEFIYYSYYFGIMFMFLLKAFPVIAYRGADTLLIFECFCIGTFLWFKRGSFNLKLLMVGIYGLMNLFLAKFYYISVIFPVRF